MSQPGLKDLSYTEWLQFLGWPTFELRRLQSDLICYYKILFALVDTKIDDFVQL